MGSFETLRIVRGLEVGQVGNILHLCCSGLQAARSARGWGSGMGVAWVDSQFGGMMRGCGVVEEGECEMSLKMSAPGVSALGPRPPYSIVLY